MSLDPDAIARDVAGVRAVHGAPPPATDMAILRAVADKLLQVAHRVLTHDVRLPWVMESGVFRLTISRR